MVHCAGWRCPASGEPRLSCQYGYCVASLTPSPARVEDHGSMWSYYETKRSRTAWKRSLASRWIKWRTLSNVSMHTSRMRLDHSAPPGLTHDPSAVGVVISRGLKGIAFQLLVV